MTKENKSSAWQSCLLACAASRASRLSTGLASVLGFSSAQQTTVVRDRLDTAFHH
jgi:hypothetical protein